MQKWLGYFPFYKVLLQILCTISWCNIQGNTWIMECRLGMVIPGIIPTHSFMKSWGEVRKVIGRDGKSFLEHYMWIQWHCWREFYLLCGNLKEMPGAWNRAGCEGLGRERWRGAGQGLSKGFEWGHERGHCPERKDMGQGEELEKVQGKGRINGRRSGTKHPSLQILGICPGLSRKWVVPRSWWNFKRKSKKSSSLDCSPLSPITSSLITHFHLSITFL